jgi:gas vesicle protein
MRHRKTENTFALLGGAVLGAAAMYLLDPEAGRRRRATITESAGDALRATGEAVGPAWESLSDRARDIGQRLSEGAQSMGSSLSDRAAGARDSARDAGSGAYDSARGALGGAYGSARDTASNWMESLGDWGRGFGKRAGKRARGFSEDVSERARRLNPWHEEESHATAYTVAGISAAALGAAAIYLLDPQNGRRRRAMAVDQMTGIVNQTGRAFRQSGRYVNDLMNRGRGAAYETSRRFGVGGRERVSAEQLLQRVRADMGHVVSHAGAIQVMADGDGVVTLSGRVLASEVDALLTAVNKVSGVSQVINRLDVQDTVEGVTESSSTMSQRL